MNSLKQLAIGLEQIPTALSWYLTDLAEAKGRQQLFTRQSPQRLKVLREHALIESAVSSNRIEGVEIDQKRVGTVIFGRSLLHDRREEEIRGYRRALNLIHQKGNQLEVSEATILELHRLVRAEVGDAGRYKQKDSDIIEKSPDGSQRVRFQTVSASKTRTFILQTLSLWHELYQEPPVPALIALAAFNLDFLCIHPFRDGNGRVSRLLLLLQCYHLGLEVGRYIPLERIIEQNKERYYETLEQSSRGWHQGKHNPWPYITFLLFILKTAYAEFEERLGRIQSPRGTKTELIELAINAFTGEFTLSDLERICPGVSRDMIRTILRRLRQQKHLTCQGRGPAARWRRKGNTSKKG